MNGLSLKLFLIAFVVFIITDMIWLGFIAKNLYFQHYGPWLNLVDGQLKPLWWATLLVYLLFALSVIVFVIPLAHHSLYWAAFYGAALGGVIYGVYDFTCLAIFKDFPIGMGLLDWFWGIFLCSWSSLLTVYLGGYLK
ncbi:DUF2177 family protein [Legionella waltersii]|uniref:Membrane protein n=1 Tax=Legionella waltersii TaxID=66969 RepID=A0A0W1ALK1_9GAMM|nr:DUF2177 family protein [Legionella waltersii]KTD82193.1 membrane protein [Legionella waltersii]SNV10636.1 membrane protein [Legionella waltersii]